MAEEWVQRAREHEYKRLGDEVMDVLKRRDELYKLLCTDCLLCHNHHYPVCKGEG